MRFYTKYVFTPLSVLLTLAILISSLVCWLDEPLFLALGIGASLLPIVQVILLSVSITKKEIDRAVEDYAYLFAEGEGSEQADCVDEDEGITFLFRREGLTLVYPKKDEDVFEELDGEKKFLPWVDVRLALASDNFGKRVRFALVLVDYTTRAEGVFNPYFLLLTEELYSAIVGLGLQEKLGDDFAYLLKNPREGIKQVLDFGYIRKIS